MVGRRIYRGRSGDAAASHSVHDLSRIAGFRPNYGSIPLPRPHSDLACKAAPWQKSSVRSRAERSIAIARPDAIAVNDRCHRAAGRAGRGRTLWELRSRVDQGLVDCLGHRGAGNHVSRQGSGLGHLHAHAHLCAGRHFLSRIEFTPATRHSPFAVWSAAPCSADGENNGAVQREEVMLNLKRIHSSVAVVAASLALWW
ncbi:hypothetical protein ABIE28_003241 [Devosia sp. 2618]